MKFLLVVLAVHFLAEVTRNKRKNKTGNGHKQVKQEVKHPAEFDLR